MHFLLKDLDRQESVHFMPNKMYFPFCSVCLLFFFFFDAGLLVGVAIATFILGLVMGGAVSFFFQKRRPSRTKSEGEECEMNFTKMEDNHAKDLSS